MVRLTAELLEQCLTYMRSKVILDKLLSKLGEKYVSLGHAGGRVTLHGLTAADQEQLGGFLQKNYRGQDSVTISAKALQKALDYSRFAGVTVDELLTAYYGLRPAVDWQTGGGKARPFGAANVF